MASKSVLIVDDNAIVRSALGHLFTSHPDFEVWGEAENGQDAIDKAGRLKPDLIILDLSMPVMTGLQAAPVLRKMLPQVALILFTHHDGHPVEILAKAAGIDAVVPKSMAASRLIAQAQTLLVADHGKR
jgi:two-component system, NarL family, nitrate/nitrite response regulator NarL